VRDTSTLLIWPPSPPQNFFSFPQWGGVSLGRFRCTSFFPVATTTVALFTFNRATNLSFFFHSSDQGLYRRSLDLVVGFRATLASSPMLHTTPTRSSNCPLSLDKRLLLIYEFWVGFSLRWEWSQGCSPPWVCALPLLFCPGVCRGVFMTFLGGFFLRYPPGYPSA